MIKIRFSKQEYDLIQKAIKDNELDPVYHASVKNSLIYIEAGEDQINDLRECCSDYLMIAGFDINYKVT